MNQASLLENFRPQLDNSLHHNVQSSRRSGMDRLDFTPRELHHNATATINRTAVWKSSAAALTMLSGTPRKTPPAAFYLTGVSFGGDLTENITAITDAGSRVEVFGRVPDSSIWHLAQVLYPGEWQ